STTHAHPLLDAHPLTRISCPIPAVFPLPTSGNFLSLLSELTSHAAAPLTTTKMEIVIRRASIPPNDCTWTSMSQLQVTLLAAEPASCDRRAPRGISVIYRWRAGHPRPAGPFDSGHARETPIPPPSDDDLTSWASPGSAVAAVSAATSVVVVGVFAATAASVAGAAALLVAVLPHWRSVALVAGVPAPAFVEACLVPVAASRMPFPAAAGISGPASGCRYLERWAVKQAEGREDGQGGEAHYSRYGSRDAVGFHRDWLAVCRALRPRGRPQRRCL